MVNYIDCWLIIIDMTNTQTAITQNIKKYFLTIFPF